MLPKRNSLLLVILSLGIFLGAAYLLSFQFLVPQTARFGAPLRWKNIPLRQLRSSVHEYLGEPAAVQPGKEMWNAGTRTKQYQLIIYFPDSVATGYSIRYMYKSKLVARSYLLDSNTIR